MTIKARPIHDRIIVRVDRPKTRTDGGIWLPPSGKKAQRKGEVLAVGPGTYDADGRWVATTLKPGDRVVFGSYAGTDIEVDDEVYRVLREGNVAAVIEGDEEGVETEALPPRRESTAFEYQK